jgi:hypothetical protein
MLIIKPTIILNLLRHWYKYEVHSHSKLLHDTMVGNLAFKLHFQISPLHVKRKSNLDCSCNQRRLSNFLIFECKFHLSYFFPSSCCIWEVSKVQFVESKQLYAFCETENFFIIVSYNFLLLAFLHYLWNTSDPGVNPTFFFVNKYFSRFFVINFFGVPHLTTCISFLFNYWMNQDRIGCSNRSWHHLHLVLDEIRTHDIPIVSRVC